MSDKKIETPSLSVKDIVIGAKCSSNDKLKKCIGGNYVSVLKDFKSKHRNTKVCATSDDNGMNIAFTVENSECPKIGVFINTSTTTPKSSSIKIVEI